MMLVAALCQLQMLREKMGRIVVAAEWLEWLSDLSTEMLWAVAVIVIVEIVMAFVQ